MLLVTYGILAARCMSNVVDLRIENLKAKKNVGKVSLVVFIVM
jgi:hypothetical protein